MGEAAVTEKRIRYIVHKPGDAKVLSESWISESAARAHACRIVEARDLKKGVRHDRYLTWADLKRRRYYSAPAIMTWARSMP